MFKKLKRKIAIGLTFAMVGGLLGPADGAFSKKAYADPSEEYQDLGHYVIDVGSGEQTLDTDAMDEDERNRFAFLVFGMLMDDVNFSSHKENDITYTDIDGDGTDDIYNFNSGESEVTYGKCAGTNLDGMVEYYSASETAINYIKEQNIDYYSGLSFDFTEPIGEYYIDYSIANPSGAAFNLVSDYSSENRKVKYNYLLDTFETIFKGTDSTYLLKKVTENDITNYYLDFDNDGEEDVIVSFEPSYYVSTYYLSETYAGRTIEFTNKSGNKEEYTKLSFRMPEKALNFDTTELNIELSKAGKFIYKLSDQYVNTAAERKHIEKMFGANMNYCNTVGVDGVKVTSYYSDGYTYLDFDNDGLVDLYVQWGVNNEQVINYISETICNKTVELNFPDSVKGYKKIVIKFPETVFSYGWGEKVIDFKNDLGYLTSDSDFTNVMNFLSFTKAMNKKSDMFDLDGDGTTDITIYGSRDALVMPTESSNLLGKEYSISYTDEELKVSNFKSFNTVKFIFPDKYTNYIEYDAARGNYSDEYFKYLYAAIGYCSRVKTSVDTSALDSAGNGKLTVYYYHTDGEFIVPKGLKDPSTPDLIGYFNVKNYMRTGFTVNGKFEKPADSYYTGDNVVLDFPWTGTLYKGVKLSFKADVKDIVVPEIGKVEIVDGKAIPDIKLTYKDRELVEGEDYTITYENNDKPGVAKAIITGKGLFEGKLVILFEVVEKKADKPSNEKEVADGPKAGTTVKDSDYVYKVTKAGSTNGKIIGEVKLVKLKNKKLKSVKVANVVTINKVKYKVTAIGNKAFKKNKNITKVVIGKNVKTIGNSAFEGCKKLKLVNIKSKKLTKIGKKAFAKCKKLKKIIIKSTKLKKIGNGAVKGTSKNLVIKAPKKKKSAYEEKFKKAGNKKVKAK